MQEVSLFTLTFFIWAGITVVLIALLIYRAIVGIHEEDQLFLDRAEAALEQEQVEVLRRIGRLDPIITVLGVVSGSLILILAGIWLYRGLYGQITL